MAKLNEGNYQKRFVAYLDVLGFKELIASLNKGKQLNRSKYKKLTSTLTLLKSFEKKMEEGEETDRYSSVFSDSIVISRPYNPSGLRGILFDTILVSLIVLERLELPIRGADWGRCPVPSKR